MTGLPDGARRNASAIGIPDRFLPLLILLLYLTGLSLTGLSLTGLSACCSPFRENPGSRSMTSPVCPQGKSGIVFIFHRQGTAEILLHIQRKTRGSPDEYLPERKTAEQFPV